MPDAYLEYVNEDRMIRARWWGGEYIEYGYVAETDTGPFNDKGEPSYEAGEWVALDVINVWDHAADKARIPFTADALAAEIEGRNDA